MATDASLPDIADKVLLREPFERLGELIKRRAAGRDVIFMRIDGNLGDALIHRGAEAFLQDIGCEYKILEMSSKTDKVRALGRSVQDRLFGSKTLFLFSGGGGWHDLCLTGENVVRRQMKVANDIIVLPSTFERMLLPQQPTLFIRDIYQSRTVLPDAPFCHDMAFYLALVDPDRLLPNRTPPGKQTGLIFRTDNERRIENLSGHPKSIDISSLGTSRDGVEPFLRHIDQFEHIVTDRLHAAIAAALLGKRVSVVRGSYFKIEAIFKSSMEGIFPDCSLIDDDEAIALARTA